MTPTSQIGLRGILERNSIKNKDIAAAVGVREETVSRWLSGTTPGSRNLLDLLAFLRRFEPALQAEELLS